MTAFLLSPSCTEGMLQNMRMADWSSLDAVSVKRIVELQIVYDRTVLPPIRVKPSCLSMACSKEEARDAVFKYKSLAAPLVESAIRSCVPPDVEKIAFVTQAESVRIEDTFEESLLAAVIEECVSNNGLPSSEAALPNLQTHHLLKAKEYNRVILKLRAAGAAEDGPSLGSDNRANNKNTLTVRTSSRSSQNGQLKIRHKLASWCTLCSYRLASQVLSCN